MSFYRIQKVIEYKKKLEQLKQERREINKQKENKVLGIIKAKNQLSDELEEIKDTSKSR